MATADQTFETGVEFMRAEQYEKALKLFNQLIKSHPERADFWSERGVVYFHMGQKKLALGDFQQALKLEPKNPYRYSSRAYVLGHYGKTADAIRDYEKAIELDPEDAIAVNNLGLLQEQMGYKNKAKSNFDRADSLAGVKSQRGRAERGIAGEEIQARNIQKELDQERKNASLAKEMKQVFTKAGFQSFLRFIKQGLKLPKS